MYNLSLFVWLHRYSVCFKKKKIKKINSSPPPLQSVLLLLNCLITIAISESSFYGRSCAFDMYSTGSWLGCKILLFGRLWGKKTLKFSLVRGSMVRGSLHHKISHNIENYLQWDFFFFPFSSVLISLFISLIESGFDIVCGKSCLVHSFISSFPGKQLGVHIGSPSLLHTLPFWKPQRISVFLNNVQN